MSNPLKRARVESESSENGCDIVERHPDLWFDDGSIIFKAENMMFKVHRSLLSSYSTFFADMFSVPQPAGQDTIEGCVVVEVPDNVADFTYLLRAIYDPNYAEVMETSKDDIDLDELEGILRLSTKYDIKVLRRKSVRYLKKSFPSQLDAFGHESLTRHDLAQALLLCREFNILEPLPSIYYGLTEATAQEMWTLRGLEKLPFHELKTCFLGREKLLDAQKIVFHILANPQPSERCSNRDRCIRKGAEEAQAAQRRSSPNLDRLQTLLDGEYFTSLLNASRLCGECKAAFTSRLTVDRQNAWERLPGYFGLGTWEELRDSE